jgi:predicted transcriptional regulator
MPRGMTPTLGYPSRSAAVAALRKECKSTREIAELIGVSQKVVLAMDQYNRSKLTRNHQMIKVSPDVYKALVRSSRKRHLRVEQLTNRVLEIIVNDGLLEAVLDD